MSSFFYNLTHPFEEKPIFLKLAENPPDLLTPALNHIGWLVGTEVRDSSNRQNKEATGNVTVTFLIEEAERTFTAPQHFFVPVPDADAPPDLDAYIRQSRKAALKQAKDELRNMDKASDTAHAARMAERSEAQSRLARIFEDGNRFWKNWTGTGEPPVDPQTGEKWSERKPPEI